MRQLTLALMFCTVFAGGLIAQIPSYVPQNGLVGWWSFTGNANDSSGNGIHGTPYNVTLAPDRFGLVNNAYAFNGINGYIDLGNSSLLDFSLSDDVTFSFWFKTDSVGCQLLYFKRDNYTGIEVLACNDTIYPYIGGTYPYYVYEPVSTNGFTDGSWHHLVVVYNLSAHTITTYMDNVMQSAILSTDSVIGSINNSVSAKLGTNLVGPDYEYFNGVLDDVGIWNRVLTPTEISDLFNVKLPEVLVSVDASICNGGVFIFNGDTLTATGVYYDTIVSFPADTIIAMDFTVLTVTQPEITQNDDTLTTGTFSAYQWLLNGNAIDSATAQEYRALQNGDYRVVVTDTNGCRDTSAVVTIIGVSISSVAIEPGAELYPNPNDGNFVLQFPDDAAREIRIIDVFGKEVFSVVNNASRFQLHFDVPEGVYFLQIKEGHRQQTLKFVVSE